MINVALLGCGTVGSGVVKLLTANGEAIARKTGAEIRIAKVLEKEPEKCFALGLQAEQITSDFADILNDESITIVVELIGGMEPAFSFITAAMKKGKHIVSANKDLIAEKGKELFAIAEENQVDFYFEASVAGGIPIVYPLKQSLAGNRILEVIGILNGTTNYILSKMSRRAVTTGKLCRKPSSWAMPKQIPVRMWKAWMQPVKSPYFLPSLLTAG
jgi:homoserine dehydrogenase